MTMLKDALAWGFETLKTAVEAKLEFQRPKKVDGLPTDGRTVWIENKGELSELAVPPPLRAHNVDAVSDLIAAAEKWAPDNGAIWLSKEALVLIIDDNDRRERVTCKLETSTLFDRVQELSASPRLDHQGLVRILRRDFRDAVGAPELLANVRKINFKKKVEAHSSVGQGNASLGQEIEAEATGAGEISEVSITVRTNVFDNHGERENIFKVELELEVDPTNQVFFLSPMPDAVEDAIYKALCDIAKRITDRLPEFPVFFGKP